MLTNSLSFFARVGGIALLICLCRSQAQSLMDAALSGNLSVPGWILLVFLAVMGAGCVAWLLVSLDAILVTLVVVASDDIGETIIRKLRDACRGPRGG